MAAIARGQVSDGGHPLVELYTPERGVLVDADEVSFQVFDVSDDSKRAHPVQVFPAAPETRARVNSGDLWPAGDKIGVGHVAARWAVPAEQPLGAHEVRWYVRSAPSGPEQVVTAEVDVLAADAASYRSGYAQVSDLRAEGVAAEHASDARLVRLIHLASHYVDRMTGRFFEPRAMTITLDGSGGRALHLGHPIIAVRDVTTLLAMPVEVGEFPIAPGFFRVYNRHLTQGLLDPDDRDNPRLEFFHESDLFGVHSSPAASLGLGSLVWPRGPQNVLVSGLFGYTEPDGTQVGRTPELIRHVTKLLVLRELPKMTATAEREDQQQRWRIIAERTRDQGYNLDPLRAQGTFTGDPAVDAILVSFQRPPQMGAA